MGFWLEAAHVSVSAVPTAVGTIGGIGSSPCRRGPMAPMVPMLPPAPIRSGARSRSRDPFSGGLLPGQPKAPARAPTSWVRLAADRRPRPCGSTRACTGSAKSAALIESLPWWRSGGRRGCRRDGGKAMKSWGHFEIAPKPLMQKGRNSPRFLKRALIHKGKPSDFDSAIPWFESRRPSQPVRSLTDVSELPILLS
jgi:hypothetical protein